MKEVEMKYSEYSKDWSDRRKIKDSYNEAKKTVKVMIPDKVWLMCRVVPREVIEEYRQDFIDSECPEMATLSKVLDYMVDEYSEASEENITDDTPEWAIKAMLIAQGKGQIVE